LSALSQQFAVGDDNDVRGKRRLFQRRAEFRTNARRLSRSDGDNGQL